MSFSNAVVSDLALLCLSQLTYNGTGYLLVPCTGVDDVALSSLALLTCTGVSDHALTYWR